MSEIWCCFGTASSFEEIVCDLQWLVVGMNPLETGRLPRKRQDTTMIPAIFSRNAAAMQTGFWDSSHWFRLLRLISGNGFSPHKQIMLTKTKKSTSTCLLLFLTLFAWSLVGFRKMLHSLMLSQPLRQISKPRQLTTTSSRSGPKSSNSISRPSFSFVKPKQRQESKPKSTYHSTYSSSGLFGLCSGNEPYILVDTDNRDKHDVGSVYISIPNPDFGERCDDAVC